MNDNRGNVMRHGNASAGLRVCRRDADGATVEDAEGRRIAGRAIVFNTLSAVLYEDANCVCREMIAPEAVTDELLRRSDVKLTLYHNTERILGRSKFGSGTLSYSIGADGVDFECDMPATVDGDTAVELVRSGVIDGCSFMAYVDYGNPQCVERKVVRGVDGGKTEITYIVRAIEALLDMTLTPYPAYKETACEVMRRDAQALFAVGPVTESRWREQVAEMRDTLIEDF